MLGKTVGQHLQHSFTGYRVSIDIHLTELTIGTDIVHASHVVVMGMGNQDAVNLAEGLRHDLLTEIRATVNEQARRWRFKKHRTTQSLVVRVGTATGIALTPDSRYATRCSRS